MDDKGQTVRTFPLTRDQVSNLDLCHGQRVWQSVKRPQTRLLSARRAANRRTEFYSLDSKSSPQKREKEEKITRKNLFLSKD